MNILGAGEPIVFAHGFGSSQGVWKHQVDAFQDTYQIILFDQIGAVPSNFDYFDPDRYTSIHAYAEDLLQLLTALDLKATTIVAHSMSGLAALLASLEDSERIRKVITIGTSSCYHNREDYRGGFHRHELDAIYTALRSDYATWSTRFAYAITESEGRPQDAADFARTLSQVRPDIALAVLRLAFECDHRRDLPHVSVPVDVVQSGHDIAVPMDAAAYLAHAIPNATFSILHTTRGHLPHLTAPSLLNDILLRCLD